TSSNPAPRPARPSTWSGTAPSAWWSPWSGCTWRSCACWPSCSRATEAGAPVTHGGVGHCPAPFPFRPRNAAAPPPPPQGSPVATGHGTLRRTLDAWRAADADAARRHGGADGRQADPALPTMADPALDDPDAGRIAGPALAVGQSRAAAPGCHGPYRCPRPVPRAVRRHYPLPAGRAGPRPPGGPGARHHRPLPGLAPQRAGPDRGGLSGAEL